LVNGVAGSGRSHLKDETDFLPQLTAAPCFGLVRQAIGADNEHPGYTDVLSR